MNFTVTDLIFFIFISRARWNALATTPSAKISCARLLSEQKYTVRINSPWSFQPGPPLERHLKIDKRWTGSLECTLQQTGAKKKILYILSRPESCYIPHCSCGTTNQQADDNISRPSSHPPQEHHNLSVLAEDGGESFNSLYCYKIASYCLLLITKVESYQKE